MLDVWLIYFQMLLKGDFPATIVVYDFGLVSYNE